MKKRVIIVDDDSLVLNIYRLKLTSEGFGVEVAMDGQAGLDLIMRKKPDLVILDLMLPKIPGIEILRRLRATPEFASLPVVVLTNAFVNEVIQEAIEAGANEVLTKATTTPKTVLESIRRVMAETPAASAVAPAQTMAPVNESANFVSGGMGAVSPVASGGYPAAVSDSGQPPIQDSMFRAGLGQNLLESMPDVMQKMREAFEQFAADMGNAGHLYHLFRQVNSLTGNASLAGLDCVAHFTGALETLLREMYEKPVNINHSSMRTALKTIDFLPEMIGYYNHRDKAEDLRDAAVMVLDDDRIARQAVCFALSKAGFRALSIPEPFTALNVLLENHFDLLFIDIEMPGKSGFELFIDMQAMPNHYDTPVIFISNLMDFDYHVHQHLTGDVDLIAKPFSYPEIAVKALMFFFKGRMIRARRAAAEAVAG